MINLGQYSDIGTHWVPLYALNNNVTILIVLDLNRFQRKPKHLLVIKT